MIRASTGCLLQSGILSLECSVLVTHQVYDQNYRRSKELCHGDFADFWFKLF